MATKRNATKPRRKKKSELEQLVEAQAQGEQAKIEGVAAEGTEPQANELDNRTSKGINAGWLFSAEGG